MLPFLSKFLRNFPAIQTKQILKLVAQARQRGEIINEKDLKEHLSALADVTSEEELKMKVPFLFFYEADVLESDAVKTFMESVQRDTDACLGEVEHLGNAIRTHHRVLVDHYFNSVDAAITELEKKVKAHELLAIHKTRGFNTVPKVFDFSGSISVAGAGGVKTEWQNVLSVINRGDNSQPLRTQNEILVTPENFDATIDAEPTTYSNVLTSLGDARNASQSAKVRLSEDGSADFFGKDRDGGELFWSSPAHGDAGLSLGKKIEKHLFKTIEIISSTGTTSSDKRNTLKNNVSGNNITNVIDGLPDTHWSHSVKVSRPVDTCNLKLFLGFSAAKRINSVLINPVSMYPMVLTAVSYLNTGESEVSVTITETEMKPGTITTVDIGDVTAKGIFLTFKQTIATNEDFVVSRDISGDWQKGLKPTAVFDYIEDHRRDSLLIPGTETDVDTNIHYYDYSFGFKDILALEKIYEENGQYVPESFAITKPIDSLSLYANIDYPSGEFSDVEFSIRKENYSDGQTLEDIEVFPILPAGTSQLQERLFLTQQVDAASNDAGQTRFYPDFTETFSVYSNDTLLTLGTDYEISVDSGENWETTLSFSGTPEKTKRCLVKLLSPRTDKIFTVVYSPLISTQTAGGEVFINDEQTVTLEKNETYVFDNGRAGGNIKIKHSNIMLQIVVRSNTLNNRVTPYLKDAILLLGTNNG